MNLATWLDAIAAVEIRYFPIDGGAGATIFAQLPGMDDRLRPVASPRHADLIVVAEPVSERMIPAIIDAFDRAPTPRRVASIDTRPNSADDGGERRKKRREDYEPGARLQDYVPVSCRVDAGTGDTKDHSRITRALRTAGPAAAQSTVSRPPEELLLPLRSAAEREIATEDVVMSIGPIQSPAAGPLQLVLVADGEQVVNVEVRAGFAGRDLEQIFPQRSWDECMHLAEILDPLAPVTGRTAFVESFERLHDMEPSPRARDVRELALRLERAASHLLWLTRFAELLAHDALAARARIAGAVAHALRLPPDLITPGDPQEMREHVAAMPLSPDALALTTLLTEVRSLTRSVRADRLLALRTRGVGAVSADRARAVRATGPVLAASDSHTGDVLARILARLDEAMGDLSAASGMVSRLAEAATAGHSIVPDEPPPSGRAEASVRGPRGVVTVTLTSSGNDRPASVTWTKPSLAHLALVPDLVEGRTIPDVLAGVASLDLSMAEADG